MPGQSTSLYLPDEDATACLGKLLAGILRPGDVVLLQGGLGAGKTSLARAIIRALVKDDELVVPSPSFALVQPYQVGAQAIIHADLYRLADAREIDELGILDDAEAMVLVEWAERAPELADKGTILIDLDLGENGVGRKVVLVIPAGDRDIAGLAAKAGLENN